jgi:hypothetical protein
MIDTTQLDKILSGALSFANGCKIQCKLLIPQIKNKK